MKQQEILKLVDTALEELCTQFQVQPTLFFTENDIVCYFYYILQQKLLFLRSSDKDGCEHFLIHREYPTPFRCSMSNNKFELKGDEERNEKGRKYKRGHYDIVVLNPDFIRQNSYEVIKAQDYELNKEYALVNIDKYKPMILYCLEFMYKRDPLIYSRGNNREKSIDEFVAKVIQDADKIMASKNVEGFMRLGKMITFVKGSSKDIIDLLNNKLSERSDIKLYFSY